MTLQSRLRDEALEARTLAIVVGYHDDAQMLERIAALMCEAAAELDRNTGHAIRTADLVDFNGSPLR